MMNDDRRVDAAEIEWGAPGDGDAPLSFAPRSLRFGDVYFSGDGLAETGHVFLDGNNLAARFNAPRFRVGELGFGTGLNFLTAWSLWRKTKKPDGARLDVFSVEAFPLRREDMKRAHEAWSTLSGLGDVLRRSLPPPHPGLHLLDFGDVRLSLFYGDVLEGLSRVEAAIDAWFFDGFSPAKNPAMWSPEVFAQAARLSKPGATFATFTVAGGVRQALEDSGFAWEKRPGFGRKKEMLAGRFEKTSATAIRAAWFAKPQPLPPGAKVAVIGAGVAGASLAHELAAADFRPVVLDSAAPASGASGNPAGLIMPRLDAGDTADGAYYAAAFIHTVRKLNEFGEAVFNPCGVIHHATDGKERLRQEKLRAMSALPEGWMHACEEGLCFPQGGVVDPPAFVRALLGETPVIKLKAERLVQTETGWRILGRGGETEAEAVVIANGLDALRFAAARTLPLAGSAGQIDWFPAAQAPARAHAFGPYAAPAPHGGLIIGATYAPVAIGAEARFTPEATQSNIAAVARAMPALVASLDPQAARPRAAVRCTTPDRLPVAGPLPDWGFYGGTYDDLRVGRRRDYPPGELNRNLFILSGLGSRGLVTAPFAAALMVAELAGAPVDGALMQALHPARFFIRDLKRAGGRP